VIFLIILLVSRAGSHGNDVDSTPNGLPAQVAVTVDG
jgi:hypothetical protein